MVSLNVLFPHCVCVGWGGSAKNGSLKKNCIDMVTRSQKTNPEVEQCKYLFIFCSISPIIVCLIIGSDNI